VSPKYVLSQAEATVPVFVSFQRFAIKWFLYLNVKFVESNSFVFNSLQVSENFDFVLACDRLTRQVSGFDLLQIAQERFIQQNLQHAKNFITQ